jgi:hypothetical protein
MTTTPTPTMSAPITFRHVHRGYPVGNGTPEQKDAARKALGFGAIFNSFTNDEVAEIIYRARMLRDPPPRPPAERRALYRKTPFYGMRYDTAYPDPFHEEAHLYTKGYRDEDLEEALERAKHS